MKITLIQGSPHKQGASNILAEQFQAGAKAAGHEVFVFDAAHAKIGPCLACEYCTTKDGGVCCCHEEEAGRAGAPDCRPEPVYQEAL